MYVVIEWFGFYPSFCTVESSDTILVFETMKIAQKYADEECQIGQVVNIPADAMHRLSDASFVYDIEGNYK